MGPPLRADGEQFSFKADAVIFYAQNKLPALEGQVQTYPIGAGVFADVGEGLPGNAEDLGLSGGRKRSCRGIPAGVERHGEF